MTNVHESVTFHPEPPNWKSSWVIKPLLGFSGIFLTAVLFFNSPILFIQAQYALKKPADSATAPTFPAPSPVGRAPATTDASELTIPGIGADAPIVYVTDPSEAAILGALENGVVHYPQTALPGQGGNVVIFGHSSEDWWQPGNYKFIFTLLDKVVPGNMIYLTFQSQQYAYQVTGSKVVESNDMAVLNASSNPKLTLITCSPVGTSLRRLIVTANQISPSPQRTETAPSGNVTSQSSLPSSTGVSVDFSNGLSNIWGKLTGK